MSDDEEIVFYGNALDPIDEDTIPRKKPITVEDQFAKDEHGRRRFHGAFTGGFSAGFYNSVGSLEGWQPKNFISSRSNRVESQDQSIFDFMDDEDKGEHGICPISLQVKPSFDNKASESSARKRTRIPLNSQHLHNAPVLQQMLKPVRDTIGVKLLMKMGWKPGQGIGPRVTKKEKKFRKRREKSEVKVYGCSLPPTNPTNSDSESSDSEIIDLEDITFAPDDYQLYVVNPKQNAFGLGYEGMDRKPILSSKRPELSVLTVAGKSIRGQAFGVSVFENDDDDIYSTEDMSNYDFSLPSASEQKQAEKKAKSFANDNCIEGFHIASKPQKPREQFPLPVIPADFVPLQNRKSRWDCPTRPVPIVKITSSEVRTSILNDDVMNVSNIPLPDDKPLEKAPLVKPTVNISIRPFASDPEKQSRYEKFLTYKDLGLKDRISSIYPSNMTEWEKEREKTEFEQAARLYRPLAEDLSDRFTSSSQIENVHDMLATVEKTIDPETELLQNAAKSKMFGTLTRRKFDWIPDKVICKRFNVPEPFKNTLQNAAEKSKAKNKTSLFEFLKISTIKNNEPIKQIPPEKPPVPDATDNTVEQPIQEIKTEENKDLDEEIRNITDKVDLFRAIFLDSSDDEESEEVQESQQNEYIRPVELMEKKEIRYSPARGIFANLDLESLKSKPSYSKNDQQDTKKDLDTPKPIENTENSSNKNIVDDLLYGPKIPVAISSNAVKEEPRIECIEKSESDDEKFMWVEKSKKHKKHKKHKKQKHKKHK